jgi:hypothetical protein
VSGEWEKFDDQPQSQAVKPHKVAQGLACMVGSPLDAGWNSHVRSNPGRLDGSALTNRIMIVDFIDHEVFH